MSYSLKGEVKVINDVQQISDSFKKREFVITDASGQYPQHIMFQAVQDRCEIIDAFKVGDMVEVFYNLRGREWTSPQGEVKYFNTLEAWRITPMNQGSSQPSNVSSQETKAENAETFVAEGDDDLPF